MDWKECNEKKLVKKIGPDQPLIDSLKETSNNKAKSAAMLNLTETTSSSILSLYYDSLRELLEAIAIKNGFKIYNHECYSCFLKEVLKKVKISEEYDSIRKLRNSLNYYGKKLSLDEAKTTINDIKKLINLCKEMLKP